MKKVKLNKTVLRSRSRIKKRHDPNDPEHWSFKKCLTSCGRHLIAFPNWWAMPGHARPHINQDDDVLALAAVAHSTR
jgi:hypothetical protein